MFSLFVVLSVYLTTLPGISKEDYHKGREISFVKGFQ
jgi:hypothetical protein